MWTYRLKTETTKLAISFNKVLFKHNINICEHVVYRLFLEEQNWIITIVIYSFSYSLASNKYSIPDWVVNKIFPIQNKPPQSGLARTDIIVRYKIYFLNSNK